MDITTKKQLGSLADRVVEKIRQVASALLDAAQQLDEAKADVNHTHTPAEIGAQAVPLHGDVTIPVTGWVNDTTVPGCSKRYDIPITGVTANDQAEIRVKPASMTAAEVLSTTNETVAGKVRIWAAAVPTAAIAAEYWIERG